MGFPKLQKINTLGSPHSYLTPVLLAVLGGLGSPQRYMRVAGGRAAGDFATRQARFPTVGYRCEAGSVLPTSSSSTLEIYSGIVWLSFFVGNMNAF